MGVVMKCVNKLLLSASCLLGIPLCAVASDNAVQQVPQSTVQVQLSYAPIVKKVAPAVLNIYTKRRERVAVSPFMNDPFFNDFFSQGGGGGLVRERVVRSLGSGVLIHADGTAITSRHVINGSDDIVAVLSDGREFQAKVVSSDASSDLAVLKLQTDGATLPFIEMRDSDELQVGDLVLALGNPFGVGQTVTSGIVSALARSAAGISDYSFFIQTDAAINPGNSGGALVDMSGKLVGINTAIYSKSGGSIGIGFAIPSAMVKAVLRQSERGGQAVRAWLGALYQDVTSDIAQSMGLKTAKGVLIRDVMADSPAADAGLVSGDVIVSVGGKEVATTQDLKFRLAVADSGQPLTLGVVHQNQHKDVTVTLALPPEKPVRDTRVLKGMHPLQGLKVSNLSPRVAMELGLDVNDTGVIVVEGGGQARAGIGYAIGKGDRILSVNRVDVTSTKQLESLLSSATGGWVIQFQRGNQVMTLQVVH
jgi:Do/DeqQ family serine protease